MNLGKLNTEITIERKSTAVEPIYGSAQTTWVPLAVLPGSPEVAERFMAEVVDVQPRHMEGVMRGTLAVARVLTRITLRWRDDIDASMRVTVHGDRDRLLQIVGGPAEIGGRKTWIELLCEEISSK